MRITESNFLKQFIYTLEKLDKISLDYEEA